MVGDVVRRSSFFLLLGQTGEGRDWLSSLLKKQAGTGRPEGSCKKPWGRFWRRTFTEGFNVFLPNHSRNPWGAPEPRVWRLTHILWILLGFLAWLYLWNNQAIVLVQLPGVVYLMVLRNRRFRRSNVCSLFHNQGGVSREFNHPVDVCLVDWLTSPKDSCGGNAEGHFVLWTKRTKIRAVKKVLSCLWYS